jgi:hypothetical protein
MDWTRGPNLVIINEIIIAEEKQKVLPFSVEPGPLGSRNPDSTASRVKESAKIALVRGRNMNK